MSDATADQSSPLQGALSIQQDHKWSCSSFLTEPLPGMALPFRDDPLPAGWRWVRIGDVCVRRVPTVDPRDEPDAPFRYVDISGVDSKTKCIIDTRLLAGRDAPSRARQIMRPGDVLVATTRPNLNAVTMVPPELDGQVCSTAFCVLRPLEGVDPTYLFWYVQSAEFIRALVNLVKGALYPAVTDVQVRAQTMPLPPLPGQRHIAVSLAEQMAAVDRARAAAEAQLAAADRLPAAYLRAAFDGPESQQWPRRCLGDLLVLRKEVVHPHDHPRGHGTFVGLEHVESGTGARTGSVSLDLSRLTGRKPRFYRGDIVYGYLRPYLNKVWLAEFDGYCSVDQYVYTVRPHLADAAFVAWFMRSPSYLDQAPVGASPGQLPRIRTQEVASVELPLAALPEQRRVAALLTRQQAAALQARRRLGDQLTAVEALPAGLLRRAFAGGI